MAFLQINGLTIPVLRAQAERRVDEIGKRERLYSGEYYSSIRAIKRQWRFSAKRMPEKQAEQLEKVIRGEGHLFPFVDDVYSTKGMYPDYAVTNVYTLVPYIAADLNKTYDWSDDLNDWVPASPFDQANVGAVWLEENMDNIFDPDEADAESGYSGVYSPHNGATLSDVSECWQGSNAVQVVTDSSPGQEGILASFNPGGAGTSGNTYTVSVYVRPTGPNYSIKLLARDQTNMVDTSQIYTLTKTNGWHRCKVTFTLTADSSSASLYVMENVAGSAYTFVVDGFQAELGAYPTAWTRTSRDVVRLAYLQASELRNTDDLCFSFWTTGPREGYTTTGTIAAVNSYGDDLDPSIVNRFEVRAQRDTGNNWIGLFTGTTPTALTYTSDPWDGNWHHFVCINRPNAETGENTREIWMDGVLVASTTSIYNNTDTARFYRMVFGSFGGSVRIFNGPIADLMILPFAPTEEQILAWYSLGKPMSPLPVLYASGDFDSRDEVEVVGEVGPQPYKPYSDSGTWRNNAREINFMLYEK